MKPNPTGRAIALGVDAKSIAHGNHFFLGDEAFFVPVSRLEIAGWHVIVCSSGPWSRNPVCVALTKMFVDS